MLTIIKGALNSRRDQVFCEAVKKAASECSTDNKSVLVIVPDQYSFECDKKLYYTLGIKAFNQIETAGFNRLAELISRKYRRSDFEKADENIRFITMFKAIEKFKSEKCCLYYKRSLGKSRFVNEMIDLVTDLIRSGISPEDLRIASDRLSGSISGKLFDISKIYSYYIDSLEASGRRDSYSSLADAIVLAKENGFFKNKIVFLDGFTDFSHDELVMIDVMLWQRADVTVSILGHKQLGSTSFESTFASTVRTCSRLLELAKAHNTRFKEIEFEEICGADETVLAVDRYFCTGQTSHGQIHSGLTVAASNDIYDELEYVCAETERLVHEENYSYREIAVAARDLSTCSSAAEAYFERYGIPYFSDRMIRADSSIVVIYLKNLFECVIHQKYHTDDILRLVKSPLFPLNDIEITNLEDHCITYNIDGDMWLSLFGSHDKLHSVPGDLDDIRRMIIDPLERFKAECADASAKKICDSLFVLLKEIKFSEQVYSVVRRSVGSDNETQLEFVRANRQIWQLVFGAFSSVYKELGEEKISLGKFFDLFKLMTSKMNISSPPQKINAVRLVDAESSRLDNVKALFVIEMNERVFPPVPTNKGLFTEREKQQLIDFKLEISGTALQCVENERLVAYRTLCLPKQRLYALYSETDTAGKSRRRSLLVDKLTGLFGISEILHTSNLPISFFCTSYKTAYYKYLEHCKEKLSVDKETADKDPDAISMILDKHRNADMVASVENALLSSEEYASYIHALPGFAYDQSFYVTRKTAKELFYPDKLVLSATNINSFFTCPFSYFIKYGLKLRSPQSISFDKLTKGNYLHRCLEALMSKNKNGIKTYNRNFVFYTEEQLREKISSAFDVFEAEEIGGSYGKSPSFTAEREKYEQFVFETVLIIQEEFSGSQFVPEYFEYRLVNEEGESILEMKLSDELTVKIVGSIDRVDVFTDNDGRKYIRIIDYKTGDQKFDLEKIYHGLNMQLLIYLLALTYGDADAVPGAVMYSRFKEPESDLTPPFPGKETDTYSRRLSSYKPKGIINGSDTVIKAFNTDHNGAFMPINLNNDGTLSLKGEKPVTELFIKASEEFARRKIISLAKKLSSGLIPAEPKISGKYNPCTNCEGYAVCGRVLHGDPEVITIKDRKRFIKEVNNIEYEMKGGSDDA